MLGAVGDLFSTLRLAQMDEDDGNDHSNQMLHGKKTRNSIHLSNAAAALNEFISFATHKPQVNTDQKHEVSKNGKQQTQAVIRADVRPATSDQTIEYRKQKQN